MTGRTVGGSGANRLLPHLERALGRFDGQGFAEPEWNVSFSAFRWSDVPQVGVDTLVSFGIGRHVLGIGRPGRAGHRQEIAVALARVWREAATAILVSTGMYMLERHAPMHLGETVRIPPELGVDAEMLIVRSGDELVEGLGTCGECEPPLEILWLAPLETGSPYVLDRNASGMD